MNTKTQAIKLKELMTFIDETVDKRLEERL